MSVESQIRIVIADDHALVREGLAALINRQPDMMIVGEAATGEEAVELVRQHSPDIILMDLRMPGMSGVEATIAVGKESPRTRTIILTTYDGDEDIYRALQAGARAYLLKDVFREALLSTIRAVHSGQRHLPSGIANRLAERVADQDLTSRERDVLELIVRGKNNKEIAQALRTTEGTIKGYVNAILGKLGVRDRTQAAITAVRRGIVRLD